MLVLLVVSMPQRASSQTRVPGTLMTWGATATPEGQTDVIDIACGGGYGGFVAALNASGAVLVWPSLPFLEAPKPAQSGVMRIAAGNGHLLALKDDGSVVAWGRNDYGQAPSPPEAQTGVIAIAAGDFHSVALKANGSVVAWGANGWGSTTIPAAAREGVVAIAAGYAHTLALKADGSVIAWGKNSDGECDVPIEAHSGVAAIAAGGYDSVAIKTDGTLVIWGWGVIPFVGNIGALAVPPEAQSGVEAVAVADPCPT